MPTCMLDAPSGLAVSVPLDGSDVEGKLLPSKLQERDKGGEED